LAKNLNFERIDKITYIQGTGSQMVVRQ